MDVYVIPLGRERYELYCESPAPVAEVDPGDTSTGWFARLRQRFTLMVQDAETRKDSPQQEPDGSWWERVQRRLLGWVAERIAEQRLLWNLRREVTVQLVHPPDMTFDQAVTLVKRVLRRDHDRHRIWFAVHGLLLLVSAVLAIVPGPNLVAYYFGFRFVGHWLSMRGASQGLYRIAWNGEPSARLGDLRATLQLGPTERAPAVQAIAADLGLPSLASFIERVSTQ